MSILPQELPRLGGVDFGAAISPARTVGGDFYDIFPVDEDSVGVLIGDVTDKGVPSAIFMARVHALLLAEARQDVTPRQVLQRVNDHILGLRQAKLFTTVLYGLYHLDTGEFSYARAGHLLPLLGVPDGGVRLANQHLGQPLGMFSDPTLDENVIPVPQGGTLLLYTDGITDCRNSQGEMFGMGRLKSSLKGLLHAGAQGICDGLMGALADFQEGASQDDDVTLIAIRRK
jgi:sigma-B regulation protein RsbU (phosphoserine phosphatase)